MGDTRVGIVGEPTDRIEAAVTAAGATPVLDAAAASPSVTFTIAHGMSGLRSVLPAADTPVLPVGVDWPALESIPTDALPDRLSLLCSSLDDTDGSPTIPAALTVSRPVFEATCDSVRGHALGDVTLVAGEPARISEFTVVAGTDQHRRQITSVRADGVVVATPLGSHGYAHAAGGPILGRETAVASVVPIGPFSTTVDHWIVSNAEITLTVDRTEPSVELLLDGTQAGTVPATETVTLRADSAIETIQLPGGLERL